MIRFLLIGVLIGFGSLAGLAQVTNRMDYDIKLPKDLDKACRRLNDVLRQIPPDIRFSTHLVGDSIIMTYPDIGFFSQLIEGKNDGIAIDLVQKEQFQCDNIHRFPPNWSHKGFLMPPMYRDDLASQTQQRDGYLMIYMGKLPRSINRENTEANFLLLDNKNFCSYTSIVNIDFHGWMLLDNGLYYDTLTEQKLKEKYRELNKTLRFTIPFEKNKSEYNPADIRPMYDSLRMTDYAIRTISIRAYTSVEGSYERNATLQEERSQSIVRALQSFQTEKIQSTVTASENWVEFLDDFASSQPALVQLSKEEIKEKLKSPQLLARFEPVLSKHRKAIIEVTLEKRLSYRESNSDELKTYFQQTIEQKNIDEALYLQQIIFQKIQRQELPETFLEQLEVPRAIPYGSLLMNRASFVYDHHYSTVFEAIKTFTDLGNLLPGNSRVDYNLCALKLQSWILTDILVEPSSLRVEIKALEKKGIHPSLVRRLMLNYNIILSEMYLRKRNFVEKDKAVKYIYDSYKPLRMSDDDLVNLAKYFSHNSRFDLSRNVLEPRINSLDASEDLVFYYLNLTIYHPRYTKGVSYRATMLNAVNGNRERFCRLFNASGQGGISFQLLEDTYLKKTYCENCKQ